MLREGEVAGVETVLVLEEVLAAEADELVEADELAEAAEKYRVFSAMSIANVRMRCASCGGW